MDILERCTCTTASHAVAEAAQRRGLISLMCCSPYYCYLQDSAEFGRIGRYYATESMLVWDNDQQKYVADATPSYGKESLEQFFERAVKEGLAGQELGDAAIF